MLTHLTDATKAESITTAYTLHAAMHLSGRITETLASDNDFVAYCRTEKLLHCAALRRR